MSFDGKKIIALSQVEIGESADRYRFLLLDGEQVLAEYKSIRDSLIFTDKRIISIDVQGITGKKLELHILPFSKATSFSVDTSGSFDLDAEFKIWASGLGKLEFGFVKGTNVLWIAKFLSQHIL